MTVNFYTFSKNPNSTKRPSSGMSKTVRLKDGTSIINPVLEMDRFSYNHAWNYCYIPDFKRYYFINDTVYNNAICEVSLNVDVLATWKTDIGASTQYVTRAASDFDTDVLDNLYPIKGGESETVEYDSSYPSISDGVFILGVQSVQSTVGSVCYYAVEYGTMAKICARLMNYIVNQSGWNQDWIPWAFQNALIDPLSKIVSCKWFPGSYGWLLFETEQNSILVGDWTISDGQNIKAKIVGASALEEGGISGFHFPISSHPQISRGKYLNLSPYTETTLVFPPFGALQIDNSLIYDESYLYAGLFWDWATGLGGLKVYTTSTAVSVVPEKNDVLYISGNVGVDIQLSQIIQNVLGVSNNLLHTNPTEIRNHAMLGMLDAIGSVDELIHPRISSIGATGNFASFGLSSTPRLIRRYYPVVDDNPTNKGKPLMQNKQISTLSGYIICDHVELDLPATETESTRVKSLMEGGFYYE